MGMPIRARALGQAPQAMGPQEGSQLCLSWGLAVTAMGD